MTLTWAAARARGGNAGGAREKLREARALGVSEDEIARYDELTPLRAGPG